MTLSEKREKQKVIIDELYALTEKNAPENEEGSFLHTKLRELVRIEMEYYGIKFESEDEEVIFEILYSFDKLWVGNFNEEAEFVNGELVLNTPKLFINLAYPYALNIFDKEKDPKYRLNSLRLIESTLFHEMKHFRQFLMQRSNISSRETLLSSKENMYIRQKGEAYGNNHDSFSIEADAEMFSYTEAASLGISDGKGNDNPQQFSSPKELGMLIVPNFGFVDRDEFLHNNVQRAMASDADARLYRELFPLLKREYRDDLKERTFSELLKNYKKELSDVNRIEDIEKRSILSSDIHDMYMEIFKRKVLEDNPIELYDAVREHGLPEVKRILFSLQEFNTSEKRRRIDAINKTAEALKKESEELNFLPDNMGTIVDALRNDGSVTNPMLYVRDIVNSLDIPNEEMKKFLLSRNIFSTIPKYGHFNLKSGKNISIGDFIDKFLIPNLEKVEPKYYYMVYLRVIKEYFKTPYEMDTMYALENANRQYQTLNNQISTYLELPFIKNANALHAHYSIEELNLMSMVYKVCANDPAALRYFVPQLTRVGDNFVRKFYPEQIKNFVELFKVALRLNKDKFFNPKGISFYEKLYNHPQIISLKEEMDYQVGYGIEEDDDEEMELW